VAPILLTFLIINEHTGQFSVGPSALWPTQSNGPPGHPVHAVAPPMPDTMTPVQTSLLTVSSWNKRYSAAALGLSATPGPAPPLLQHPLIRIRRSDSLSTQKKNNRALIVLTIVRCGSTYCEQLRIKLDFLNSVHRSTGRSKRQSAMAPFMVLWGLPLGWNRRREKSMSKPIFFARFSRNVIHTN